MDTVSQIEMLAKRDGTRQCHYCKRFTNNSLNHALMATRDHVLPRSMGGSDELDNFVLACRSCNNKRGTSLFYCKCDLCVSIINAALDDPAVLNAIAYGIFQANKVKIYKDHNPKGLNWIARKNHVHRRFHTYKGALKYANNGTFRKGE